MLVFPPLLEVAPSKMNIDKTFLYCRFGTNSGCFVQVKGWKNRGESVGLSASAGHQAVFRDRRVFPYKFLLRHYPIRSQEHGIRKVLTERQPRWDPVERAVGWHVQYDRVSEEHRFVERPDGLIYFDYDTIYREFLVEAISGVGIPRISPTSVA